MPQPTDHAAYRRDQRLARTRRVSLWVAGGAAAASLGLGTAFAHDLPGHHAPAVGAQPGAGSQNAQPHDTQASPEPGGSGAASSQTPTAQRPASGAATDPSPAPTHLSQPQQPPATTPAPAQTVSGGS
jgi:hypothetical protein